MRLGLPQRVFSSEDADLVCGGRLFHTRAAAIGNVRSPRVDRWVDGTSIIGELTVQMAMSSNL